MPASTFDSQTNFDSQTKTFPPCPDSPNCVSTQEAREDFRVQPIYYSESTGEAKTRLRQIISEMPRATIVREQGNHLHVEFRSRIFKFVDDVEFYFDDEASLIHSRSAAQKGYADLGANRNRFEEIRSKFHRGDKLR